MIMFNFCLIITMTDKCCGCGSYFFSSPVSYLQQIIQVAVEALGQSIQQLAERPARAGGECVFIGGEGGNKLSAGLQHRRVSVLLHNPTDLSEQQVQVLADREKGS